MDGTEYGIAEICGMNGQNFNTYIYMESKLFENVGGNQFKIRSEDVNDLNRLYKSSPLDKLKDLGYANGWGNEIPDEVKRCKSLGHQEQNFWKSPDGNKSIHGCTKCGYKFTIDSSS